MTVVTISCLNPDTMLSPVYMLYPSGDACQAPTPAGPGVNAWVDLQVRPRKDAVRVSPT